MAKLKLSDSLVTRHGMAALLVAAALGLASAPAMAQVPGLDFYVGAGIGQSNADISADDLEIPDFDKKDTAWKLFAGLRASMFGAELEYINFGKPEGSGVEVEYKGLAAYGLLYAPLPLPVLDIYAKAGLAKVDVDIDAADINDDDTKFSYGIGAQLKFGSFAIRGEYQKFKFEEVDPSLLSVSFSYSFL